MKLNGSVAIEIQWLFSLTWADFHSKTDHCTIGHVAPMGQSEPCLSRALFIQLFLHLVSRGDVEADVEHHIQKFNESDEADSDPEVQRSPHRTQQGLHFEGLLVLQHRHAVRAELDLDLWRKVQRVIPQSHWPNRHKTDLKPTKIIQFGERSVYSRHWFGFVGSVSVYVRADKFVGERFFKHAWKISPRQIVGCLSVTCRCGVGLVGERSGTCRS